MSRQDDDRAHNERMIRTLERRLRVLELQRAERGLDTPAEVQTEIATLERELEERRITEQLVNGGAALATTVETLQREDAAELFVKSQILQQRTIQSLHVEFARLQEQLLELRADVAEEAHMRGLTARAIERIGDAIGTIREEQATSRSERQSLRTAFADVRADLRAGVYILVGALLGASVLVGLLVVFLVDHA